MGCGTGKPQVHTAKPLKGPSQGDPKNTQPNKDLKNQGQGQNQPAQNDTKTNPINNSKETAAKSIIE